MTAGSATAQAPTDPHDPRRPEVVWSARPSVRSLIFGWLLRITLRPLISVSIGLAALGVRFGPKGIELWPIWERLLLAVDRLGLLAPRVPGTTTARVPMSRCRAEWVRACGAGPAGPAILYFHGGGYVGGGIYAYRRFASKLSAATGTPVLNVGYRLLPRSPISAAIDDGIEGYQRLLDGGHDPRQIVLAGDSAGGGLACLVAVAIRARGLPRPAGIVAMSPWTDLDPAGKLDHPHRLTDPVIPIRAAAWIVEALVARDAPLDPDLSVVNLDLAGLPPTLIHAGTTEVLEPDATTLAQRLAEAGVDVRLKHWQGQVHVFQVLGLDVLPEAREALREIGEFVRRVTAAG